MDGLVLYNQLFLKQENNNTCLQTVVVFQCLFLIPERLEFHWNILDIVVPVRNFINKFNNAYVRFISPRYIMTFHTGISKKVMVLQFYKTKCLVYYSSSTFIYLWLNKSWLQKDINVRHSLVSTIDKKRKGKHEYDTSRAGRVTGGRLAVVFLWPPPWK